LFYGYAKELSDERLTEKHWQEKFLETIKEKYNDKNCFMCKNVVPEEGCVIRIENLDFEAYKQKSFKFYEKETKDLDKGIIDIETEMVSLIRPADPEELAAKILEFASGQEQSSFNYPSSVIERIQPLFIGRKFANLLKKQFELKNT